MLQVGTRGEPNARILVVGDVWNSEDNREGKAFAGNTGVELENILKDAGIDPRNCYYTNVVNAQPAQNNIVNYFIPTGFAKKEKLFPVRGLFPDEIVLQGIDLLEELINDLKPKAIIALGNYALWALSENDYKIGNGSKANKTSGYKIPTGIIQYRGSQLRSRFNDIPLLPTFHPAAALKNYPWRYLMVHDLRARLPKIFRDEWDEPERNYIIAPTFETVMQTLISLISRAELSPNPLLVSTDIETTQGHLECIGFGWSANDAICIPIMCSYAWKGYWRPEEEVAVVKMIKKVLEHPNIFISGQNFLYDYQHLFQWWGIRANYRQDTMLAHHTVFPGTPMGLDHISSLYCSYHRYWKEDGKVASRHHDDQQRWIYNCTDCVKTYEATVELWKVIEHYKLQEQYSVQMVRARSAIDMMNRGVAVDHKKRKEELDKLNLVKHALETKLERIMPISVWPRQKGKSRWFSSSHQIKQIFYGQLGVKTVRNDKTYEPTVDDDALNIIANREPQLAPICHLIQQYRSLKVFSDFLEMKLSPDQRARCTFSPTTTTFRYRSGSDAFGNGRNMQNIPSGTED